MTETDLIVKKELIEALEAMALQYLSDVDGNVMTHDFMIAGEKCLDILEALRRVKTKDGIYYTWIGEKDDSNF